MTTKFCKKCSTDKPLEAFGKAASSKDGLSSKCRACVNAYMKEYSARQRPSKASEIPSSILDIPRAAIPLGAVMVPSSQSQPAEPVPESTHERAKRVVDQAVAAASKPRPRIASETRAALEHALDAIEDEIDHRQRHAKVIRELLEQWA